MEHSLLVSIGDACQLATIPLTMVAYVPQWLKLYKNKSSGDFSPCAWSLWAVSCFLALIYALIQNVENGGGAPLIWSCAATLLFMCTTIGMVLWYRPSGKGRRRSIGADLSLSLITVEQARDVVSEIQKAQVPNMDGVELTSSHQDPLSY